MTWVKIDDLMPENPKILEVGPAAAWLYVCAICYAGRNITDGFIPFAAISRLISGEKRAISRQIAALVAANLLHEGEGGYHIHDYHEHQASRDQVQEKRRKTRERVANWRSGNAATSRLHEVPVTALHQRYNDGHVTPM